MRIGGLNSFSLSDFPGRVAAVVFTQGCNFRCPYCHNGSLIPMNRATFEMISQEEIFMFLEKRRIQLSGVVVSGGEPTLQPDLSEFFRRIGSMGYQIKLDTNGSHPEVLAELLMQGLVDFIAMDIKAPFTIYDRITGVCAPKERLEKSIELIARSGIDHEFRTTVVGPLLSERDLDIIKEMVPHGSRHRFQEFRPENALDPELRVSAEMKGLN
ncbi:MAG: anaerobic ribonucleoside-triphosphate reductase activating protein [delta proteobacterium ML8_D]|nr:MAG: anaerobic ribonucleoside-triphosphate reductase activating protein [delta proteobacterium ML8_D]